MDGVDPIVESDTLGVLSELFADASLGRRLGDFTLHKRLGRGAQGDVYEARQESLGRLVALKILAPHLTLNPDRVQRFRREAEAGGRLGHPNIVGVHAVGAADGFHFIVQELVAGGRTLGDRIANARNEPELPRGWYETTAELFVQVADALHAAHEAGIVHRDVKPGNILIAKDGVPKVADFGLAMVLDDLHRSVSGELIGTPFYMSPEQTSASRTGLDRRTDIFSLGVTLYEALTLWRPFDAENREGIVEQIRLHDPRDPRRVRASVPRDLSVICMKAMEKRPERRYQSAGELADELRRFLRHEPILARSPGPIVRAAKWARRHPVASATGSVTVAALVIVTALLVETALAWKKAEEAREATSFAAQALKEALQLKEAALAESQARETAHKAVTDVMYDVLLNNVLLHHYAQRGRGWQAFRRSVDQAAEMAAQLGGSPDAQFGILSMAGVLYARLGLLDEADKLITQAATLAPTLEPAEKHRGNVVMITIELGRLRMAQGRPQDAEPLFDRALQTLDSPPNDLPDRRLGCLADRCALYLGQDRLAEAEHELARLELELQAAGRPNNERFWSLELAGELRQKQGRLVEAREKFEAILDESASMGPQYDTLQVGLRLVDVMKEQAQQAGDAVQAESIRAEIPGVLEGVLGRYRETYPAPNLGTARLEMELGVVHRQAHRLDQARPPLEDALAICLDLAGPDEKLTLFVRNNLANLDFADGHEDRAEAGWREIVSSEARHPQADHEPLYGALKQLGDLAYKNGRCDDAERWARQLVDATPAEHRRHAEGEAQLERLRAPSPDNSLKPIP